MKLEMKVEVGTKKEGKRNINLRKEMIRLFFINVKSHLEIRFWVVG